MDAQRAGGLRDNFRVALFDVHLRLAFAITRHATRFTSETNVSE